MKTVITFLNTVIYLPTKNSRNSVIFMLIKWLYSLKWYVGSIQSFMKYIYEIFGYGQYRVYGQHYVLSALSGIITDIIGSIS